MRFLTLFFAIVASARLNAQSQASSRIEIRTFQFAPDTVRVALGSKVIWVNQDEIEHTVTAGTPGERDSAFNAVLKAKGAATEHTFDRIGTISYFCDRHQFMRGTITVTR